MSKISIKSKSIIKNNSLLFAAFENRLIARLVHIFEKYKIPINQKILKKNIEENLINTLNSYNEDIIDKYEVLIGKYEKIIIEYVKNHTDTKIIKEATMNFIKKIADKNSSFVNKNISNNFIEYINSIIYVYDNHELNKEIINRINTDINDIIDEFNRNNYNYVIESVNIVIKGIISSM
ncbi:MAG: hypothetical protein PUA90_05135 [bacterium]|nr:hypothetical protein [bacterium]